MSDLCLCRVVGDLVEESSFSHEFVEKASLLHELRRRIEFCHLALLEDYDTIRVQNGVDPMRNGDNSSVIEHGTAQCLL